jgi:stress response protein SCP2
MGAWCSCRWFEIVMQQFVRGQRAKLSQLSDNTNHLAVEVSLQSARVPVFDFVCFGIDERGQLSDDRYMVFFNQLAAPDDAVTLRQLSEQKAEFEVHLDQVPPQIVRLVFTVSVDGTGEMKDLDSGLLSVQEVGPSGDKTLLQYRFTGADFQTETALMLAEIYRKDGEWRVWAQGQGFAGNLGALLRHFGGQEIEETALPALVPVAPPVQPSPPISAPAATSPTVSPPPPPPAVASSLQQTVSQTPAGGTVTLPRGEHQGPLYLDKPIILQGMGAVIWSQNGPVLVVQSGGVTLRDVEIEATAPDENVAEADVALWVSPGIEVQLYNVRTRGEIIGVPGAAGTWKLPPALDLGEFAPRAVNSFVIEIETPQQCDLKADIQGVSLLPARLGAGKQRVEILVQNVSSDTFLAGNIQLSTGGVARTIPLSGRSASEPRAPVQNLVLWNVNITSVDGA